MSEEELQDLDRKVKQLKLDYERYFLGTRPREPMQLRGDVEKRMALISSGPIQNTALRFKYGSICSRFQAFKRQWNETLRQIENGTYTRHRFKADLHRGGPEAAAGAAAAKDAGGDASEDLYSAYRDARLACGQPVKNLTPRKLEEMVAKQRSQLEQRYGADASIHFRVVVEEGRAKLKVSRDSQ
ncbi:MAG: hypothetical protein JRH16_09985 [Deltaproteobacteria bacterium]|nr:hypothetical protein [Deltaproteobacteria bacterium]MBW2360778.1 hypothetical protein [Deltaproteobacteria bacterium]